MVAIDNGNRFKNAQADTVAVIVCGTESNGPNQFAMNWKAILTTMAVSALTIFVVFRLGVGRTQIVGA